MVKGRKKTPATKSALVATCNEYGYKCSCGFEVIAKRGNDEKRIRKQIELKEKLHKKVCQVARETPRRETQTKIIIYEHGGY